MYLYGNDFIRFYTRTKFNADLMFDNNTAKLKFKTADNYIYTPTTNDLGYNAQNQHNFSLSGTSVMTLSGGNVGIGTTTPDYTLTVSGNVVDKHFKVASGTYKTLTTSGAAVGIGTDFALATDRNRYNEGLVVKVSGNTNDTFLNTDNEIQQQPFRFR